MNLSRDVMNVFLIMLLITFVVAVAWSWHHGHLEALDALPLLLLGGLTLGSFWLLVYAINEREGVGIESHWGGIGGGIGGWRLTPGLVFLLLTIVFGVATAATAVHVKDRRTILSVEMSGLSVVSVIRAEGDDGVG